MKRGHLPTLDAFIPNSEESATNTFPFSVTYQTSFGAVTAVPTTYTNAAIPVAFRMGYVQDQNDNIVIITQVTDNRIGYDGDPYDFQAMLPTDGTNTTYYVTVDLTCVPVGPRPSGGGGTGGGGSGVPIPQPPPMP